jgi:large subunit ribosomal protein L31e
MAKKVKTKTEKIEREYVIPLLKEISKSPKHKRANKAIKTIKQFLVRHMQIRDRDLKKIKLDKYLNETIWSQGIKHPPKKIKVKAIKENEEVRVELVEFSDKLKFKKLREEKKSEKAKEAGKKKKIKEKETSPKEEKEKVEEGKKEEEKKSAVVEETQNLEKQAAKKAKHQTKIKSEPKHQKRVALQK